MKIAPIFPLRLACVALALAGAAAALAQTTTRAPDERALWLLWRNHTNGLSDHAGVVFACREFVQNAPQDPFVPVALGLEAWHLLKQGSTNEALRALEALLARRGTTLDAAGADLARGWLTRLDREQVAAGLQQYHRRHVEYPEKLEALAALPPAQRPPLADRWGSPWVYRRADFTLLKGFAGQRYALESAVLKQISELAAALALPYATAAGLKPLAVVAATPGQATLEFEAADRQRVVLTVGADSGGIRFAYQAPHLIVFSNGLHWQVVPMPGAP